MKNCAIPCTKHLLHSKFKVGNTLFSKFLFCQAIIIDGGCGGVCVLKKCYAWNKVYY